jgi:hypothetical protein
MSDSTSERNERLKATMSQKETPLNKGPAQVPCSPNQSSGLKRPLRVTWILGQVRKANWALPD